MASLPIIEMVFSLPVSGKILSLLVNKTTEAAPN